MASGSPLVNGLSMTVCSLLAPHVLLALELWMKAGVAVPGPAPWTLMAPAAISSAVPVVPLPCALTPTPADDDAAPRRPMPEAVVPLTPQPLPACEPQTPIPNAPVPLLIPRTAAELLPGAVEVTWPRTPTAPLLVDDVSPTTAGSVPVAARCPP